MTRVQRRILNDAREREIRANLNARRPVVTLVPRRLARLGLTVAIGALACFVLALAGCSDAPEEHAAVELPGVEAVRMDVDLGAGYYDPVVFRFDDQQTGATCYLLTGANGGAPSISCILGVAGD